MKTGKSLVELAKEIERQNDSKEDLIVSTRYLELDATRNEPFLSLNDDEPDDEFPVDYSKPISSVALRQISDRMGIPAKYAEKMLADAPELMNYNVNHWFKNEPKNQMVRIMDGRIRGFLSDKYARIDNYDVASMALPILENSMNGLKIVSAEITEKRMYIKAITPRMEGEVVQGDVVQAGVVISNSEIGFGALTISPMIYRLVCDNGMISQDGKFRRHHVGARASLEDKDYKILSQETVQADDRAILLKTRDYIKNALSQVQFDAELNKLREAAGLKIEGHPEKGIEVLAKASGLNTEEAGGVLRHLIEGGDLSKWGVCNAVTRFSQDVDSYDRASELESLGGKIIEMGKSEWSSIALAA